MDISKSNPFTSFQDHLLNFLLRFLTPQEVIHVCKKFAEQQPVIHKVTIDTNNDAINHMEIENMRRMARVYDVIVTNVAFVGELINIRSIQNISLSGCRCVTDDVVKKLAQIPNLFTVNLSGCTDVTDDGIKHLQDLTKLTQLDISCGGTLLKGSTLHLLKGLKHLRLWQSKWVKKVWLEKLIGLEELTVHCWEDVNFANLVNLRMLKVKCENNKITLPNQFGSLEELVVLNGRDVVVVADNGHKHCRLRALSLDRCGFKEWSVLRLFPELKYLSIHHPIGNKDELAVMNKEIAGIMAYLRKFSLVR